MCATAFQRDHRARQRKKPARLRRVVPYRSRHVTRADSQTQEPRRTLTHHSDHIASACPTTKSARLSLPARRWRPSPTSKAHLHDLLLPRIVLFAGGELTLHVSVMEERPPEGTFSRPGRIGSAPWHHLMGDQERVPPSQAIEPHGEMGVITRLKSQAEERISPGSRRRAHMYMSGKWCAALCLVVDEAHVIRQFEYVRSRIRLFREPSSRHTPCTSRAFEFSLFA